MPPAHRRPGAGRLEAVVPWGPAVASVIWLVGVGLLALTPALAHGTKLGPFDISATVGLGTVRGVVPHSPLAADQIKQMVPWADLAWTDVHHGHLPLWNPYSGLGTPLAFNFQSAVFSLPMLVAYLSPLRFAFTVYVLVKMILAGTGIFFLCRVAGCRYLAATLGGTIFELSGAFGAWAGWPMTTVFCMFGWVLGAALLVLAQPRWRHVVLLAVAVTFAVYGGHPESTGILLSTLAVFVLVVVLCRARRGELAAWWRPVGRLGVACAVGLALAAPLLLPGFQILSRSVHSQRTGYQTLPLGSTANVMVAGYYGFRNAGSTYFGPVNYYETAAFVGVVALALAALALLSRWRRPEVLGLAVAGVLLGTLVWVAPAGHLVGLIPGLRQIDWLRGLLALDGVLAALAGIGLQAVIDQGRERRFARRFALVAGIGAVAVALLGLRQLAGEGEAHAIRDRSLLWPAISVATCVVVAGVLWWSSRRSPPARGWAPAGRAAALTLFAAETAFLVTAAPGLWASSPQSFVATPAEAALERLAGSQRVGFVECPTPADQADLGILAETNAAYGVAELEIYDPALPRSYLSVYDRLTHGHFPPQRVGTFCPSLTTASLARVYGVSLLLSAPRHATPPGAVPLGSIGGERAFGVPGGNVVTIQPTGTSVDGPRSTPVAISYRDPSTLTVTVDPTTTSTLALHVADYPGWSATVDHRPLALEPLLGDELQAVVGPGRHTITLRYRPAAFEVGLAIAVAGLLVLVAGGVLTTLRRRRTPGDHALGPTGGPDREAELVTSGDRPS